MPFLCLTSTCASPLLRMIMNKNSERVWLSVAKNLHKARKVRPPLKTLAEMAELFNLTISQLRAYMVHSGNAPKCVLQNNSTVSGRKKWYNPLEMQKWWKTYNDKKTK